MIIIGEKGLRDECVIVRSALEGLDIADRLREELSGSAVPGIGLAANQIGLNKRVFVMSVPGDKFCWDYVFINPKITAFENPMTYREGCLSFPGEMVSTFRYGKIKVIDLLEPSGRSFEGLEAVVVQHEVDHLNKITMHDRRLNRIDFSAPCMCGSNKPFKDCCAEGLKQAGTGDG